MSINERCASNRTQLAGLGGNLSLPTDTLDTISADKLEQAGRALSLALMIIGRETQY